MLVHFGPGTQHCVPTEPSSTRSCLSVTGGTRYKIQKMNSDQSGQHLSTQVDCALAESFYRLNDNIEAFADVDNQEIEKPFLQTHDLTPKESLSFAVL